MKILFLHPDLGVGGAERLILDTAIAAKSKGHEVTILTNQYDTNHCFEDSKELAIVVKYNWIPRQLFGRFHALLAYLKLLLAAMWAVYVSDLEFDVAIVDQISLPVAVFRLKGIKCLFYCHFPDQLLCVYDRHRNVLKRLYRAPIDWLEATTTGMADVLLVNSHFTSQVFRRTFTNLADKQVEVLYPSLNTDVFDALLNQFDQDSAAGTKKTAKKSVGGGDQAEELARHNEIEMRKLNGKKFIFLSINRYERKKDLALAVRAMRLLREKLDAATWSACHLVMAGGYDYRVCENVDYYDELRELASSDDNGGDSSISFLRSISDKEKTQLLRRSFCLLYTPTNEHFGIVPVEAMYCEKPVLATSSGGPLETVLDGQTGFLVDAEPEAFADKMSFLVSNPAEQQRMSRAARDRVVDKFSFLAFKEHLNQILHRMVDQKIKKDK